jgi:hypothetical protein
MQQPPLLPEETLTRVLRLAKFDGMGAMVLGGIFAIGAAGGGDSSFAAIGLLAAGAGAVELHGVALLRQGEPRGMNWLIGSQPFLLLVIFCYCALRLWFVAPPPVPDSMRTLVAVSAAQWQMSPEAFLIITNRITAIVVAIVSVGFQGGMTIYYLRRREPVRLALIPSNSDV